MIRVGGATDVEAKERLRRTEGSLAATRAAMAEGFVPGGGTALLRAETRAGRRSTSRATAPRAWTSCAPC